MIDPTHEVPIVRQAQLLDLSRSSVYYLPQAMPGLELALMQRIDELHLEYPFAGARMLCVAARGLYGRAANGSRR